MSVTTVPTNLVQKAWAKDLYMEVEEELFFQSMISAGADTIITKNTDLKKEAGDQVTIPLLMKLSGDGVTGDSTLEGYEEQLSFHDLAVTVDQIRNGVRLKGRMEEQKTQIKLRGKAKDALKVWLREKIERTMFNGLCLSPSSNRVLYGGDATATAEIVAADKLTSTLLSTARRKAVMASPKIRPISWKGKLYYVVMVHPYAMRDLKTDATIKSALENGWWRGEKNPLFAGADLVWDGMVVHEHTYVPLTTTGASDANVAHNVLLGAQAGSWGVAEEPFWEEDDFDYHNAVGFATGMIHGFAKSKFNDEDFATIAIETGAAAD